MGCVPFVLDSSSTDYKIPMLRVEQWPGPETLSPILHREILAGFTTAELVFQNFLSKHASLLHQAP